MVLKVYQPVGINDERCVVTITPTEFRFSVMASKMADLGEIQWMRIYSDSEDRLIVFEPVSGVERIPGVLTLGTQGEHNKKLVAKGFIANTPWIKAIVNSGDKKRTLGIEERKFELKKYSGALPPLEESGRRSNRSAWYIQLMPAFEKSIVPSEINQLSSSEKGIYRYLGGDNGEEIIYIGKGSIRDRFQQEPMRQNWNVTMIQYSILQDDQKALEWEAWWIQRFKKKNNGLRPRFNRQDGHRVDCDVT